MTEVNVAGLCSPSTTVGISIVKQSIKWQDVATVWDLKYNSLTLLNKVFWLCIYRIFKFTTFYLFNVLLFICTSTGSMWHCRQVAGNRAYTETGWWMLQDMEYNIFLDVFFLERTLKHRKIYQWCNQLELP